MHAAHFWDKFALYRNKIGIVLALTTGPMLANGQIFDFAHQHNPHYDDRKFSYGFVIGLHTSAYQVKYSNKFVTKSLDTVSQVIPSFSIGFSLGFLVNYHIAEFLDLRLLPKASFYNQQLRYYYTNRNPDNQLVETTVVEFPLLLKYRSVRRGNVRMYMIGGITPGIEASGKNDVQSNSASISINKTNLSLDTGLGFDFYFPLFKLSEEIRFSRGLVNMLGPAASPYAVPLKRLNTNTISIYFIFQ
jgi:hypothetical protein